MVNLRRLTRTGLLAVVLLALAIPVPAAEVDKFLPDETEFVSVTNVKNFLDAPLIKKNALDKLKELLKGSDEATKVLESLGFDPFKDLTNVVSAGSGTGPDS